jgi:hypothetical protein
MGSQLRFYLLPTELDQLLTKLKLAHGIRILSTRSDKAEPQELEFAISSYAKTLSREVYSFGQYYLVSDNKAKTPMWYAKQLEKWHIDFEQSEAVELSTCDYGPDILREGRLYFQKDMLSPSKEAILPKNTDFVKWAEAIFRTAKRHLLYSREFEAYVGSQAEAWRQAGGKFIASVPILSRQAGISQMIH